MSKKYFDIMRKTEQFTGFKKFGFEPNLNNTFVKELEGQREIFEIVDWTDITTLEEIVDLQKKVWGMPIRDVVPSNLLAIVKDTGGFVIVAKNKQKKIEGFLFTLGQTDGGLFLHMIGVDPKNRYKKDLGWNLSILQYLLAKKMGVKKISWTYDPLRGSNSRLNLEKLGVVVRNYTINKYGKQNSELYGLENPTDRFTAEWDIDTKKVRERIEAIQTKKYIPKSLQDVAQLPILNKSISNQRKLPRKFLIEIPYDIDKLPEKEKIIQRMKLRNLLASVLTTYHAEHKTKKGEFMIDGFATGLDTIIDQRRSFYILRKKLRHEQNN